MTALGVQCETVGAFASPRGSLSDEDRLFIASKLEAGVGLQNISVMVGRPVATVSQCLPGNLVRENMRLRDEVEALQQKRADYALPDGDEDDLSRADVLHRWRGAFDLRPAALRILARLVAARGKSVSREALLNATGSEKEPTVVNVYICHIRKALAKAGVAGELKNDWGMGYRLSEAACEQVMARVAS